MSPLEAKSFGTQIARLRKSQGLSQENLAKESGVPVTAIRRCEQKGQIPLERYLALVSVLHARVQIVPDTPTGKPMTAPTFRSIEEVIQAGKQTPPRNTTHVRKPRLGGVFESKIRDRFQ
ncbi:MAG: helix-turn-helix transcriptional regulator [Luteolibacter sp.]